MLNRSDITCNGNAHRKLSDSWDIKDYGYIAPSFERFCQHELAEWVINPRYYNRKHFHKDTDEPPTKEQLRALYGKYFRRK